jgi:hypothetical protein
MLRKIMTVEEREIKDRRNKRIIGIILGIIMLLSTAGYAFLSFEKEDNPSSRKIDYKGVEFVSSERGTWKFNYAGVDYETLYNPYETINITSEINTRINQYYNKPIYFGIESKEDIAISGTNEIERNFLTMVSKSQFSCLNENCSLNENYPIKNCASSNVIIFNIIEGDSSITEEDNCIVINYILGDEEKAADAFIFKVLGL